MEINRRYVFRPNKATELIEYLEANEIPFEFGEICVLNIYESSPFWPEMVQYTKRPGIVFSCETIYSKEELNAAEWLKVWCRWRCGYPQPELTFSSQNTTYTHTACSECGSGKVQIAPFRIKKNPNWKKRHFAELNWIGDELFLSPLAKQILENNNVTGITFERVLNRSGTEVLDDVYQLGVSYVLPLGFSEGETDIKEATVCSICGQKKYVLMGRGMTAYKRSVFDNAPDVVKTGEIFGGMKYAVRSIMIRQKVYQTIISNHLERGLVFAPIALV